MISRTTVRTAAKQLAQDSTGTSSGVQLLVNDPGDYNLAISQALRIFSRDRPNQRVVDAVLAASGFRVVLAGSGALAALAGGDAWVDGASTLQAVWTRWLVTAQDVDPKDPNLYRVVRDPGGKIVLELLDESVTSGDTLRLAFTAPHALTDAPDTVAVPAAPTVSLRAPNVPGGVNAGVHAYKATYVTAQGETLPSAAATVSVVSPSAAGQVAVVVAASAVGGVTSTKVYRTVADDLLTFKLAGTITGNGGTLVDTVADDALGAAAPSTNTAGGSNTVLAADEDALALLAASLILELAAVRAAQNTGNTGLPNDVVDRRSQSDIYRARSKELRDLYAAAVGLGGAAANVPPASGFKDLDVIIPGRPALWHSSASH